MRDGWRETTLEQVLEEHRAGFWGDAASSTARPHRVNVIRNSDIARTGSLVGDAPRFFSDAELERARLLPGDVALTTSGEIGKAWLVDREGFCATNFVRILRPEPKLLSPGFIRCALEGRALRQCMAENTGGSTIKNLLKPFYTTAPILLPPLDEQRRIVDLIAAVDEAIEATQTAATTAFQAANALRSEIFTRLAAGPVDRADALFEMLLGRQKSERQSVGDYVIPYLRAANITDDGLKLHDLQRMNFEPAEQILYCLRDGDVLLVEGGSIGNVARWSGEVPGRIGFDKHLIRLRERRGKSTSEYAVQWAKWSRQTGAFTSQATGITIKALGFGRASAMPVPSINIYEQAAVTAPLKAADDLRAELGHHLSSITAVRSALLDELLSGEHAIPASYDELLNA